MPSSFPSYSALRQSRTLLRRNNFRSASTTTTVTNTASEAATKAKDSASGTVSKASEGLTKVTSSAGNIVSGAATGARNTLGKIGGRTGRLISHVESLVPPTLYYARVGLELSRIVFHGQKMYPPSLAQFQSYFQPVINVAKNPKSIASTITSASHTTSPATVLSSVRNVNTQQLASLGIVAAELLGFFTVGTMIGRMKIVGYRGEPSHEH